MPQGIVWLGAGPAASLAHLLEPHGVSVEHHEADDAGSTPASPRTLVVSDSSWRMLAKKLGSEDAALAAIVILVTDRAKFHEVIHGKDAILRSLSPPLRRVLVVGVSGPSCSGKSTVAETLTSHFNSPLVPLKADKYFDTARMNYCSQPEFKHMLDYEHPDGIAWDILLDDLQRLAFSLSCATHVANDLLLSSPSPFALAPAVVNAQAKGSPLGPEPVVLILEGFLTFASKEVAELCSARIFLEVECKDCLIRRWCRDGKRRPDRWEFAPEAIPEMPTPKFERWFEQIVWSAYEQHLVLQRALGQPWLLIDAAGSPEDTASACINGLKAQGELSGPDIAAV